MSDDDAPTAGGLPRGVVTSSVVWCITCRLIRTFTPGQSLALRLVSSSCVYFVCEHGDGDPLRLVPDGTRDPFEEVRVHLVPLCQQHFGVQLRPGREPSGLGVDDLVGLGEAPRSLRSASNSR